MWRLYGIHYIILFSLLCLKIFIAKGKEKEGKKREKEGRKGGREGRKEGKERPASRLLGKEFWRGLLSKEIQELKLG